MRCRTTVWVRLGIAPACTLRAASPNSWLKMGASAGSGTCPGATTPVAEGCTKHLTQIMMGGRGHRVQFAGLVLFYFGS